MPIWVSEQGIGKVDAPETEFTAPAGRRYDSYFPVPFFISPRRGYGVLVEGTERIVFELCSVQSDAWRAETWSDTLSMILFVGDTPAQILERATAHMGRPPMPPDWALLPWVAIKGGTEVVRQRAAALRTAGVPASAIWSEDWLGESINPITGNNIQYHWEWDPTHYPDLAGLVAELHATHFRFLGYFNPFVTQGFKEWDEAVAGGFLPKRPDGTDYDMPILLKTGSVVDLTLPAARDWLRGYLQAGLALGLDGWMADFAEWVPFDARFADGRTGAQVSSDYPRLWQAANREVCHTDCVFFVRSGFTGSAALATAVWGGDQNTDFGEDDGLPTALRIGVGLGLSGVALYGTDIAGYTSLTVPPSDKELYFRWTELGAFQPLMRTHEGNAGPDNWLYDRDAETLEHFRRYAERHTRLFPFWRALFRIAATTGLPPIRHPALHYPESDAMVSTRDTYLLGDSLYVAPVVARDATERALTLPPGTWADVLTGERHTGAVTVAAPVGEIPVLQREGSLVPRIAPGIQTTPAAAEAAASHLIVTVVLGADGRFTLADGTTLEMTSASAADPGPLDLPGCTTPGMRGCTTLDGRWRTYRLAGATLSGQGFAFTASDATRTYDVVAAVVP